MEFHGLPWWNWTLQGIGVVASYVGAELNARLDIRGFYVWLFSNVVLFALHAASGLWLLCILDAGYFRLNILGPMHWKRKKAGPSPVVD